MKYIKKFEGVADKYAAKKWFFEDPDKDFEFKYQNQSNVEEPIAYVKDDKKKSIAIFKNPKTLKTFEADVRAIGTVDGDLYVAQQDYYFFHWSMSNALGLASGNKIYGLTNKFVCLYRIKNTNKFAITFDEYADRSSKTIKASENILKNIKLKNPQFDFYNVNSYDVDTTDPVNLDITEPITIKPNIFNRFKKFIKNESFEKTTDIQEVKDKIEEEFSKYLEISTTDDFKNDLKEWDSDTIGRSNNIFLLSDDYGAKISSIIKLRNDRGFIISLNSIKIDKNTNKFKYGNLYGDYDSSKNSSIEDFVKNFIDKLKKTNEIRLKNRETVRLKRDTKKFNI